MGSKTKFDPGRRDFLKKTTRGIAGAAAATAFPGGTGGGIMETEAAKKTGVSMGGVPFEAREFMDIAEVITDKGIKPKGDKYHYLTLKDGTRVRAYAPDYMDQYGGIDTFEIETLDADGRVIDSLSFVPDQEVGPYGGEDIVSGQTRYVEDVRYFPDVDGNIDADPNYSFQEDFGNFLPDEETVDKYYDLGDILAKTAPEIGSRENKRIEREASDEIKKMEKKKEITKDKKLPAKKEGLNLKGLVKGLSKRLPPARVINVLQLLSQGLDLYEAINQAMGLPSKEEFDQVIKDMQESEFANGGIATLGV